jgi:hypothetical protein
MTNLEDGSSECPISVLPGTNLSTRYAVIVSFGVYLNGTSLNDIAYKVGALFGCPFCVYHSFLHSLPDVGKHVSFLHEYLTAKRFKKEGQEQQHALGGG